MKKITLFLLAAAFSLGANAQAFDDGVNLFSVGFGVPPAQRLENDLNKTYKNQNYFDYKLSNYGTVILKYEHGLSKYFGIGLNAEYSGAAVSYKYDYTNSLRYEQRIRQNAFGTHARFNGHFPIGDKVDMFGGVGLGYLYTITKKSDTNPNPDVNTSHTEKIFDFDYQVTLGLRFMVKDNLGLFLEAGWATTAAQVGLTFKF